MPDVKYIQKSFRGGMNQFVDPTRIADNEYMLMLNGRVRYDVVEPIAKPVLNMFGLPNGNLQGLYASGVYLLAFVSGVAYYRNALITDGNFIPVQGWIDMDPDVSVIYAQEVSNSTINFKRNSSADASNNPIANGGVNLSTVIDSSPACVVCQDGINIPRLILPDATSRLVQTYEQWNTDSREFVPIGLNMFFQGGTLYVLSPDQDRVFRSIDGKPLDFVIAVDTDGNKYGDEQVCAHVVGFSKINGIFPTNSGDGSFIVSSTNGTTLCVPRPDTSFYGEVLYRNVPLFRTGVLNQFSYVDVLGDSVLIDGAGIKSFNSVLQLKNTGKNSPFSASINNLFAGVAQTGDNCAAVFDDYALFSVNTKYGEAILLYDTLYQKFVGLDFPTMNGAVKQFAVIDLVGIRQLFAITDENMLYQLYAHETEVETCSIYVGEWLTNDPKIEQQAYTIRPVFNDAVETGTVFASLYNDRAFIATLQETIINPIETVTLPITAPFGDEPSVDSVKNLAFYFNDLANSAWKIGIWFEWAFKAKLSHISLESKPVELQQNIEQGSQQYAAIMEGQPQITNVTPLVGTSGTIVTIGGQGLQNVTQVKIGDTIQSNVISSPQALQFTIAENTPSGVIEIIKLNSITFSEETITIS